LLDLDRVVSSTTAGRAEATGEGGES
jgi:hypothetical protein